jgi:hypothetical protein
MQVFFFQFNLTKLKSVWALMIDLGNTLRAESDGKGRRGQIGPKTRKSSQTSEGGASGLDWTE